MELKRELAEFLALRRLDLIDSGSVVKWASQRMLKYPQLIELASAEAQPSDEVDASLAAVANRLNLPESSELSDGLWAASRFARNLLNGEAEPIDTARAIWRIARLAPSAEPRLRVFIGLASEWEDDPTNRPQYETDIESEVRLLLQDLTVP